MLSSRQREIDILSAGGLRYFLQGRLTAFEKSQTAWCMFSAREKVLRWPMIQLKVNGVDRSFSGDPEMRLLWYLRDVLGLTGTKFGCGVALCGACTVHRNGQAIRACVTPMGSAVGASITTIEGIGSASLHPVQKAWIQHNVPQCGYCQSGQIMQAIALLRSTPKPTDEQIDDGMAGNICRCGTYQRIRAAIKTASGERA